MKTLSTLIITLFITFSLSAQFTRVYVDSMSTCTVCNGSSWSTAFPKLQDGINALTYGDTLFIAKGTYYPDEGTLMSAFNNNRDTSFVFPNGVLVAGGFSPLNGVDSLYEHDGYSYPTILSGEIQQDNNDVNNSYHVVMSGENSDSSSFYDLIIQEGNANSNSVFYNKNGGGWYQFSSNGGSNLELYNCTFRNNKAIVNGGGFYSQKSAVFFNYCVFDNNSSGNEGGAVYIKSSTNFTNCIFTRNYSDQGGAISNNTSFVMVRSCSFGANDCGYRATSIYNNGTLYLQNSIIYDEPINNKKVIYDNSYMAVKYCILENCYYSNSYWNSDFGINQGNNYDVNPDYINANNGDLHVRTCPLSFAADKGKNSLSLTTTLYAMDGNDRIINDTIDIGAYEISSGFRIDNCIKYFNETCPNLGEAKVITKIIDSIVPSYIWDNGNINQYNDSLTWGIQQVVVYDIGIDCYDTAYVLIDMDISGHRIYVDSAAIGKNNGCTWDNAFYYLQDALNFANSGDTIFLAKGTYMPDDGYFIENNYIDTSFVIPSGVTIFGGFNPSIGIDLLSERDFQLYNCILSGEIQQDNDITNNSTHVIVVNNVIDKVSLDGIIIEKGYAYGSISNNKYGGGIYSISSNISLDNCIIRNNKSGSEGAGFHIEAYTNGYIDVDNCLFYNNICGNYAGAIYASQLSNIINNISISNTVFDQNYGENSSAIFISGSTVVMDNCEIKKSNNNGTSGSAMVLYSVNLTLTNSLLHDNFGYRGAAIRLEASTFSIENCNFDNNKSVEEGGAIYLYNNQQNDIIHCKFTNNTSINGASGAVHINKGLLNIDRCLFEQNTSKSEGGAMLINNISIQNGVNIMNSIFLDNNSTNNYGGAICTMYSNANIVNCSFYNNTAQYTGNTIYDYQYTNSESVKLINSIVWSPLSSSNLIFNNSNYYKINIYNSIVKGSNGSGTNWNTSFGVDQGGNMDISPSFVDTINGDLRLQECPPSIAINAGLNTNLLNNYPHDYYGGSRKYNNSTVDIGAYESTYDNGFIFNDSIIHLCYGDSIYINNQYITSSTSLSDTVFNGSSCDSIFIVSVLISSQVMDSSFSITTCEPYTSPSGNYLWTTSGIYYDTLISSFGCDSILNINLNIISINTTINSDTNLLYLINSADHYQWLDCSDGMAIIPGENSQSLIITQSGSYAVEVQSNGCTDTSACIPISFIGINKVYGNDNIHVYPNPSSGKINIEFSYIHKTAMISLYNSLGEKVFSNDNIKESIFVFNPKVSRGVYFLQIKVNDRINTYKLIIK